ncbi:hypothetical protein [Streptomyces sp. NPDC093984]|uniref:hypothetical protein n=1 Tax=Streptomyces sp. NPDC093984 TaxID=3366052 RepID=UPI00381408E2
MLTLPRTLDGPAGIVTRSVGGRLLIGRRGTELIELRDGADRAARPVGVRGLPIMTGALQPEDDGTGTVVADEQAAGAAGPSEN